MTRNSNNNRNGRNANIVSGASILIAILGTVVAQFQLAPRVNDSAARLTLVEVKVDEQERKIGTQAEEIDAHDDRLAAQRKELDHQDERIATLAQKVGVLVRNVDDIFERVRQIFTEGL